RPRDRRPHRRPRPPRDRRPLHLQGRIGRVLHGLRVLPAAGPERRVRRDRAEPRYLAEADAAAEPIAPGRREPRRERPLATRRGGQARGDVGRGRGASRYQGIPWRRSLVHERLADTRRRCKSSSASPTIKYSEPEAEDAFRRILAFFGEQFGQQLPLTRSRAEEWGPKVRVNCPALAPTMTANFKAIVLPKHRRQPLLSRNPLVASGIGLAVRRRAGEPVELIAGPA